MDNLVATSKATTEELHHAPSLLAFISSRKRGMLGTLQEAFLRPEVDILQNYLEEGILVPTGPTWPRQAMEKSISNGPHVLAFNPEMAVLIHGRCSGGYRVDSASSSLQRTWCGYLENILSSPALRQYVGHISNLASSLTCQRNLIRLHPVLTKLPAGRSPQS